MNILFLDLELNLNQDEGNTPTSHITDIIQIGAVVLNTETGAVIDRFNNYCKLTTPLDNKELRLSTYITKLTGITDAVLSANGICIIEAYENLLAFCKKNTVSRIPGTWGAADMQELRDAVSLACDIQNKEVEKDEVYDKEKFNLSTCMFQEETSFYLFRKIPEWYFSKYEHTGVFDVKKLWQTYCIAKGVNTSGGLRKCVNKLGLQLEPNMTYHNAVSDAYATALVYKELLRRFS